ncbi:hypothetical protein V5F53_02420 [Xanthobacter sp. V4C-4]|uniref:hypothetical protein n=1 Tax=Xanthobacter cornucopiae TaxID=3119924 RepID=UPI003726C181
MQKMTLGVAAVAVVSALSIATAWADCQSDVVAARSELEQRGKALNEAGKKKADPQTLCPLFRAFSTAEAKWVKFLTENKDWCQIPEQAIKQAATSQKKTNEIRDKVCQAAANGGVQGGGGPVKPPAQGSLSSALGVTTGYSLGSGGEGKSGVFDTLSGNVLQK